MDGDAERVAATFGCIRDLVSQRPVTPLLADLVDRTLSTVSASGESSPPSVTVPLDVYEALSGSWQPAVPLAAAATLIYLGADILDNVADRELPTIWNGWSIDEIILSGATLISSLSYLALDLLRERHGVSAGRLYLLAQRMASATWAMAGGQLQDIHQPGDSVAAEAVEAGVALKSGAEMRMHAGVAASLAVDDRAIVTAYEEYGYALGIAAQLRSDCSDIWGSTPSADLTNGRQTLPIVHALAALSGVQHTNLLAVLKRARSDPGCHKEVAAQLAAAGGLKYAALQVELWVGLGTEALRRAGARTTAAERLRARLTQLSLLQNR
jgi:geranylgeranyl diphosphate synthase, type I